jgi:hypothetical protein
MANERIKKVIIENSDLPVINATGKYLLRYRVVSEDRNRFSHWSPIYQIDPAYDIEPSGDLVVEKTGGHVLIIWNPVSIKKNGNLIKKAKEYDVWLSWHRNNDGGDWSLFGRFESNSVTLIAPNSYEIDGIVQPSPPNRLDVEIYLISSSAERVEDLKVYSKYDTAI